MTPRRLIPYVAIFLILTGAYVGLRWRQEQQVARDEQAKKVFHLKESDVSDLSLVRGKDEVRLVKKDRVWRLTAPLDTKADQTVVDSMLTTLARLRKERDLGEEKDLKPFGLDKPGLVVKFTAQGQPHQLAVGAKVPGDQNYYVLKDQDPHLLTISMGSKDSLDRQLLALRDKTLLAFISGEVKGLKVKTPKTAVALEKSGPQTWRWQGRPDFRVRGDRLEKLCAGPPDCPGQGLSGASPQEFGGPGPGPGPPHRNHRRDPGRGPDPLAGGQKRRCDLRPHGG